MFQFVDPRAAGRHVVRVNANCAGAFGYFSTESIAFWQILRMRLYAVARFRRSAMREQAVTPALDATQWAALRGICRGATDTIEWRF